MSTFGQSEGGENQIGQIEGGLGMVLWQSGISLGLLKSTQPLRDSSEKGYGSDWKKVGMVRQ